MLRSKKVRSSRRLEDVAEWAAKEAEDDKSMTKKKIKKTRSSISLGKLKPIEELEQQELASKKASAPPKLDLKSLKSDASSSTSEKISTSKSRDDKKSSSSSKSQRQKIKVQFEIVFVGLRNLPTKMHSDGSSVLVRWKSSTKKKTTTTTSSGQSVRSKAETQAAVVKATGRAGWEGVGSAEGETFVFEEKLKYETGAKKFDSKSIELVLKEIKGKKKNHLYKLKVDVGEFAHNGSTTKEIVFTNGKSSKSGKDDGPILTVIFRARWLMIDNKVMVKKYGAGKTGNQEDDYDLLTVDEDVSESEAETDTDFSESESDMSESESEAESDSDSGSSRKSKKGDKPKRNKKLEARCKQLETILLETKRELAEKKVDILQLQRQLKEKESLLLVSSPSAPGGTIRSSGGGSSSGGDLKKAIEERDLKIERLEASLKGKDDEIKAVKSLFQSEIEELRRKHKTTSRKATAEDTDDDSDGAEEDEDREEEWQMRVDRAAALYGFKARTDQEISLAKDEEFYVTDRDPFGVGTFASEWWRVVRRSKDAARSSDASDPGKARAEGLAPITYFRITRPAQKEFSFKVSTKKAASIAELQRHCGFANTNGSATAKKSKSSKSSSSPTKKNESESEDDDGDGTNGSGGNKLKSLQKDRPMQSGKRPPSRFQSLRKIAKERMKLGDFGGGGGDASGSGSGPSSPASKESSKKASKKNDEQQLKESDKGVKTTFITSDAETNRVLSDLQQEREWRDVIEKAVYCADFTQFVTISSGPSFSSSSTATPTRAGAIRRSGGKKTSSYRGSSSSGSDDSNSDSDDDSTASSRSSKNEDVDDEREEKMLAGVHELVAYIKKRKVFEDPETSLSFARLLRTALRATVQRSKSEFRTLASVLAFTTALLHCLKAQKNYLHLPPFSDDRDKFFQALFVDPRARGVVAHTEDVPKRNKLLKTAQKKLEDLTENEERGLGSYKLIVRTLVVLVLDAYLALLRAAEKEIGPQMVPAMLEQPPDFFHLFMDKKSQFAYVRPEEVMTRLTQLHSALVTAGVWGAIISQFFVDLYQVIDARLFNVVIERSDLCTSANGFQIKTAISHLTQWADNTQFLDAVATKKQLAHIVEVTSLLVLDMSVLSTESDVRDAFPTLSPKQLLHLASSFKSDSSSRSSGVPRDALDVLKKMASRLPSSSSSSSRSGSSLKLSPDVPPLVPTKEDYRRPATTTEHIVFRETL